MVAIRDRVFTTNSQLIQQIEQLGSTQGIINIAQMMPNTKSVCVLKMAAGRKHEICRPGQAKALMFTNESFKGTKCNRVVLLLVS